MAIGPLFNAAMMSWLGYDLLDAFSPDTFGGAHTRNVANAQNMLQGQGYTAIQAAEEMQQQQMFSDNLETMTGFAQGKQRGTKEFLNRMNEDFAPLIKGQQLTLAKAAMAPPSMQQVLIDLARSGGIG